MAYNLKTIKKEFSEKGIFYTPVELANYLKSFLPVMSNFQKKAKLPNIVKYKKEYHLPGSLFNFDELM